MLLESASFSSMKKAELVDLLEQVIEIAEAD
jgi:hypothetical protein